MNRKSTSLSWAQTEKLLRPSSAVHSRLLMQAAGLVYTGDGDTSKCQDCGIEISNWTKDVDPFKTHAVKSPNCPYVLNIKGPSSSFTQMSLNGTDGQSKNFNAFNMTASSLYETISMKQGRRRTFSHWYHRTVPSSEQMIEAGFFCCNVADRVICIYCNLICQIWTSDTKNPCEIHKILSPECSFVKARLVQPLSTLRNEKSEKEQQENVGSNEQQENDRESASNFLYSNLSNSGGKLAITDENTLSKLVAARLDLPNSRRLLSSDFKLSVIKRVWEDQLRLKTDDFVSSCDSWLACSILQRQIDAIDGKTREIVDLSVWMKQIGANPANSTTINSNNNNSQSKNIDVMQTERSGELISREPKEIIEGRIDEISSNSNSAVSTNVPGRFPRLGRKTIQNPRKII